MGTHIVFNGITAAGIINGLGHWWGYRNFDSADASTSTSAIARFMPEYARERRNRAADQRHFDIDTDQVSYEGTMAAAGGPAAGRTSCSSSTSARRRT